MKIPYILSLIILLFPVLSRAQDLNSRILLTVDGKITEAGEFIRMYRKSIEPGKTLNVDDYLEQFIGFKLKVADAIRQGYDTTKAFKTELNGYRTQLAQSYLTDTQTREKLLKAAYQRSLTEVNASHVLIAIPPNASAEDTLRAWDKALDVRERITKGEPFEQVAKSSSDDQSALTNGGNLGYFSVFQMITPFEDAAYSLKAGGISRPVRTPYGYHIIKVIDKRPSKGRVRVAHIMKSSPPEMEESAVKKAQDEISAVYKKLQEGAPFSELALTYSDHKQSSSMGGELDWFGSGEMISDFSEAAFAISDTGKFTEPVRTPYGWHIIKLLEKSPPRSFEESKSFLESRINQTYLNSISRNTFVERLKKEYKFRIIPETYNWFILNTDTLIIQGLKKYDRGTMPQGNLYTFANQVTTSKDFAAYIEKRGFMIDTKDSALFINRTIETKAADQLINYENSQIEKKNPEFRYLMNEFHNGILLFEISGKNVWNKVNEDTVGLLKYYEEHKKEFLSQRGIEASIYTLRMPGGIKKLESAYRKFSRKKGADQRLLKKFNKRNDSLLVITEGKWFMGDNAIMDALKWEKGSYPGEWDGYPSIISIREIIEPVPLSFEAVQGEMMAGYQEHLEKSWNEQLKQKYSVKIDNLVLGEVKKKLGQ